MSKLARKTLGEMLVQPVYFNEWRIWYSGGLSGKAQCHRDNLWKLGFELLVQGHTVRFSWLRFSLGAIQRVIMDALCLRYGDSISLSEVPILPESKTEKWQERNGKVWIRKRFGTVRFKVSFKGPWVISSTHPHYKNLVLARKKEREELHYNLYYR